MDYLSEKEQVELIKKWWRDYGLAILVAIIIGLAVGFGWRYWIRHKVEKTQEASVIYTELQGASIQQQFTVAEGLVNRLMSRYPNTPYASMGALLSARNAVLQHDLKKALDQLQWVIKNSRMESVKQIARVRAARIFLSEKQYQLSLALLNTVNDPVYQPLIDMVKGDVYRALGKTQLANQAYQNAKNGFEANGIVDTFLNMKISQKLFG